MATRRVLIVDDEALVRKTLSDILRAMRYVDTLEIEEASSGREGLDAVVRQRPDLVLLDLQMPGMGGLALLKQIREVEPRLSVRCSRRRFSTRASRARRSRFPARADPSHRAPSAPGAGSFRIDTPRTSVLSWRRQMSRLEPGIPTQLPGKRRLGHAGRGLALLGGYAGAHASQACSRGG
jgi:CheY-like chemotaxis protein